MFLFSLADQLHCTVAELEVKLSRKEMIEWVAYRRILARKK
ncbi:hypothetical protein [Kaistia algarum]|nr:hypothetical protein [Kaistia algarum]MCX5513419.1 hypothetical protein [Kaistia algarum]